MLQGIVLAMYGKYCLFMRSNWVWFPPKAKLLTNWIQTRHALLSRHGHHLCQIWLGYSYQQHANDRWLLIFLWLSQFFSTTSPTMQPIGNARSSLLICSWWEEAPFLHFGHNYWFPGHRSPTSGAFTLEREYSSFSDKVVNRKLHQ